MSDEPRQLGRAELTVLEQLLRPESRRILAESALAARFELAGSCHRCGVRVCARCDGTVWDSRTCDNCHRLFHNPEITDPALRAARLEELRVRESRIDRAARRPRRDDDVTTSITAARTSWSASADRISISPDAAAVSRLSPRNRPISLVC